MYHLFLVITFLGGGFDSPTTHIVNNKAFATQQECSGYAVRAIITAKKNFSAKGSYDCIFIEK